MTNKNRIERVINIQAELDDNVTNLQKTIYPLLYFTDNVQLTVLICLILD